MQVLKRILLLGLLITATDLFADEYPYLYRSAYHLGRGDTGISSTDNEDAIFYNPAAIAVGKGLYKKIIFASPFLEFSQDTRDVVREISVQGVSPTETLRAHEGRPQHFAISNFTGVILRRVAVGAFARTSNDIMLFKDPTQGAIESVMLRTTTVGGATFSLADSFFSKNFYAGITAKFMQKAQGSLDANASQAESMSSTSADEIAMTGTGSGVDFGLLWQGSSRNKPAFGLTVNDIGDTKFEPSLETDLAEEDRPLKPYLQTVNLGFSIEPGTRLSKFKLLVDVRDALNATETSIYKRTHLGGELTVRDAVGFTTGLNQGYGSFGLYLDIKLFRVDLGVYTEEMGDAAGERPDTRFFFRMTSGL